MQNYKTGVKKVKLSLWTLCEWLQKSGMTVNPKITGGEPDATYAVVSEPSAQSIGDMSRETVVQVRTDPSGGKAATALYCEEDAATVFGAGPVSVCNELNRAFQFYNDWEKRLLTGLLMGNSLQELLEIAHSVFHRPMFIKSDSSWAFAITGGYDGTVHPDWSRLQESVHTHQSSMEAVRAVSMDPEFKNTFSQRYPAILESPFYGGPVLHANVWLGERRVCEIVAIENGMPFNPGDPHLMHLFVSIVERYMAANRNLYFSLPGMSAFFVELIENRVDYTGSLPQIRETAGWDANDALTVVAVKAHGDGETPIISVLREQLISSLPYSCVFSYGGKVICIVDATKNGGYQALIRQLAELVPQDLFSWGMSYDFLKLEDVPLYYRQALSVLEKAEETQSPWTTMYQTALDMIQCKLSGLVELQSMIHPDIRKLAELDRRSGSRYLQTLFEFLLCGGNYTDAANHLGLHRNSLIYRISRIKEVIASDLDDMKNRELLIISVLMLPEQKGDLPPEK